MTTAEPVKHALVMSKIHAPWLDAGGTPTKITLGVLDESFFRTPTFLSDRAHCETDTSLLQLLPYMAVMCKGKLLTYVRGGGGAENRLHGLLSVGIGGHVDIAPSATMKLKPLLQSEAKREHIEEIGRPFRGEPEFTHYIYDPESPPKKAGEIPVGLVHLGLFCISQMEDEVIDPEAKMIEKAEWLYPGELMAKDLFDRLEPWSRIIAMHIYYGS